MNIGRAAVTIEIRRSPCRERCLYHLPRIVCGNAHAADGYLRLSHRGAISSNLQQQLVSTISIIPYIKLKVFLMCF